MPFGSLWLPVVVSAVVVWLASAVAHMVLKHHRSDYRSLPNEDAVRDVVRKAGLAPGVYCIPYCADPSQMSEPAFVKKYEEGPVGLLTLRPSAPPGLGKHLAQWFGMCLFVSFTASYVARLALNPASDGMTVMRLTGTVAFAGYAVGYFQHSIWEGNPWSNSLRGIADAIVYSLLTGLTFRVLW